ncbi:hypothetical protein GYMLUDRAFT_251945 [Collybiopsis luxurians FD-317 M1]|uniref:Mid2 domain-containing protein n=1 Tax=Collybiopsis luxurians FD-317 M1 TaxID=944289 RepID=A0A0D0C1G5_9AGAR|nr:hypothetical protein GYMLUDRAFT_251945 [Collybiopsis luxurians FD-317 M1]
MGKEAKFNPEIVQLSFKAVGSWLGHGAALAYNTNPTTIPNASFQHYPKAWFFQFGEMAAEVKLAIRDLLESTNVSVVMQGVDDGNTGNDDGNDVGNVTIDQGFPDTLTTSSSSTASATSARATSPLPTTSNGTPSSNVVAPMNIELIYMSRSLSFNSPPAVSGFPESSLPPETSSSLPTHLSSGVASPKSHKAVSTAVIAGSVVGSIVALLITSFCLCCVFRRRRARNQLSPSQRITTFATAEAPINLPQTTGVPSLPKRSPDLWDLLQIII